MLNAYLAQVQSLLDDPGAVQYSTANLTTYINDARVQIAGASESLRNPALLTFVASQQAYQFSAASLQNAPVSNPGLEGILNVRMATIVGGNQLTMRPWAWFFSYHIAVPTPAAGVPKVCAILQPGLNGTIWFSPIPTATGEAMLDSVCYPVELVNDSTPEALESPWQEAVQYYAAYLALLNAQRRTDADAMFARYQVFETRATQMTTPTRLPRNYPGGIGARVAAQNMPLTAPAQQGTR